MKKKLLFLLASAFVALGANAQVEPENGKAYYLYNTESDQFLTRGKSWGTQAIVESVGLPWQVTITDGRYKLQMLDLVKDGSTTGLGANGFSDNGSPSQLEVSGTSSGYILPLDVNEDNTINMDGIGTWVFLTAEQYQTKQAQKATLQNMAIATAAGLSGDISIIVKNTEEWTAQDMSSKVPAVNNSNWAPTKNGSRGGNQNQGNYGVESYQTGDATYSCTISGLQPGVYKVGIKAMHRTATNAADLAVGNDGYECSSAYLDANGYRVPIKDWYSSRSGDATPNSTGQFVEIANNGGYYSEVFTYVGEDGVLSLKAAATSYWGSSWFLFNSCTLTYYMKGFDTKILSDEIAAAQALYETMDAEKQYAKDLNTAIQAAQAALDKGFDTPADFSAAVTALQEAVAAAKLAALKDSYAIFADGKYVLSLDGKYLGAGNAWGTQASLVPHPEWVEFAQLEDGKYTISTQVSNGGNSHFFTGEYMDGAATPIEFLKAEGGFYMRQDGQYLVNDNGVIVKGTATPALWTATSVDDLNAQMTGTPESPLDVTYLVPAADFGRNKLGLSQWENANNASGQCATDQNKLYEAYMKVFSHKTTLTNLPAGKYIVKANGMYRKDGEGEELPYFFANDQKCDFEVYTKFTAEGPSHAAQAAQSFLDGMYGLSLDVEVTNGQLEIGFASEGTGCWAIYDNVQLYFVSGDIREERTVTTGKFATICLPYNAKAEGAVVYTLAGKKTEGADVTALVFEIGAPTEAESIELEAGVPYLYRATAATQTFALTDNKAVAEPTNYNGFYGTFTAIDELTQGYYFLCNEDPAKQEFRPAGANVKVDANKCYVQMDEVVEFTGSVDSRTVVFGIDGGATGITGIENAVELSKDGKFLQNGQIIIVKDGKKFNVAGQKLK